jgi:hypothetical protein
VQDRDALRFVQIVEEPLLGRHASDPTECARAAFAFDFLARAEPRMRETRAA